MAAEPARVLEFPDDYIYGTAVPAQKPYAEPEPKPIEMPMAEELIRQRERERLQAAARAQSKSSVSVFAVLGAIIIVVLMVLVVLAQISYNEIAGETSKLYSQMEYLTEQQRRLEITFESVIDMKEVERYARDILGMSKPDSDQIAIIYSVSDDRVEILNGGDKDSLREFGSFISSLIDYFR